MTAVSQLLLFLMSDTAFWLANKAVEEPLGWHPGSGCLCCCVPARGTSPAQAAGTWASWGAFSRAWQRSREAFTAKEIQGAGGVHPRGGGDLLACMS